MTGRVKDAINRGGETISPGEVEEVLARCPGVMASAGASLMIFAAAHSQLQETVALAVAPHSARIGLTQIRQWASAHLPPAMLPQLLLMIPELPRSAAGKLLRARFAEQMRTLLPPVEMSSLQVTRASEPVPARTSTILHTRCFDTRVPIARLTRGYVLEIVTSRLSAWLLSSQVYALETVASHPRLLEEWTSAVSIAPTSTSLSNGNIGATPPAGSGGDAAIATVIEIARGFLGGGVELGPDTDLSEAGVNSLAAVELSAKVQRALSP